MSDVTPSQFAFRFEHAPSLLREHFEVGASNREAVAVIDAWHSWPQRMYCIYGPPGCGKTHLGHIWAAQTGAAIVDAAHLTGDDKVHELIGAQAVVVDNCNACARDDLLFHLFNLALEQEQYMLFLSQTAPAYWPVGLADLMSRLKLMPTVKLEQPDDGVLGRLLKKLFHDRQLEVDDEILSYLVRRMERSGAFAAELVDAIDSLSLSSKRPVTRVLCGRALDFVARRRPGTAGEG